MASGTFLRSGLTANTQLLTTTYRECWLATRIIDTPAEDMTRSWYTLTGKFDPDDLADLRRLEARHSVKQELTDAIRWARLYGGSLALMVIDGEGDRLDEPLDLELLPPECFQGLLVLDQSMGISPSIELETDLNDPDYGLPMYSDGLSAEANVLRIAAFSVSGSLSISRFRVLSSLYRSPSRSIYKARAASISPIARKQFPR